MADSGSGKKWNSFQRLKVKPGALRARARKAEDATTRHARRFIVERWQNAREVRRNIALWLVLVGVLIATVAVQFLLIQRDFTQVAAVKGGTYAEGVVGKMTTLNPIYATTPVELSASRLLFSSLFDYDQTGHLQGDLATGYKTSDGGKSYDVTLRKGANWHDGKPVTVDDVLFTTDTLKDVAAGSPLNSSWQNVDVEKIDDSTVRFTLPAAYAPFPNALTFPVLPKHILGDVAPNALREYKFSNQPVGSGPFTFVSTQHVQGDQGSTVVNMDRNTKYYDGVARVDHLQLHSYDTSSSLLQGMQTHAVNAGSGVSLGELTAFENKAQYHITTTPVNSAVYALFNTTSEILHDKEVRQAIQLGTDIDDALGGLTWKPHRIDTPFVDQQVEMKDVKKPGLDVYKAKQLLDKAGWKQQSDGMRYKDKQPLMLHVVSIKNDDYRKMADRLKEQWKALGIAVNTQEIDTSDPTQNIASTVLQPRNYDVLIHELVLGADPDVYAYWHSSQASTNGLNLTNYKNGVSDDALSSARARVERGLRQAKYRSFAKQWLEDAPAIGLYQSTFTYITQKGVTAYPDDARLVAPTDRYGDVSDWSARQDYVYKTP